MNIQFVSLGPGDPDLITIKSWKALSEADHIFLPYTENSKGEKTSYAEQILRKLQIDSTKFRAYKLPMSKDRSSAMEAYSDVAVAASELAKKGERVTITAEGDGGFYSSSHFIYEKLLSLGASMDKLPGIPAFISAGAIASLQIVEQEERLIVLPTAKNLEVLNNNTADGNVLVLMKLSQNEELIKAFISQRKDKEFHYFEFVSMEEKSFYSNDKAQILDRPFPYFSLMIIK